MNTIETAVRAAFERLARAVETGDLAAYRTLARDPNPFQTQLFERNSAMIKKGGMRLVPQRIDLEGSDEALVHFAVVSPQGQSVEAGEMTFALCGADWKVDEL